MIFRYETFSLASYYRFGFQGQDGDNKIAGKGNTPYYKAITILFFMFIMTSCEYDDTRLNGTWLVTSATYQGDVVSHDNLSNVVLYSLMIIDLKKKYCSLPIINTGKVYLLGECNLMTKDNNRLVIRDADDIRFNGEYNVNILEVDTIIGFTKTVLYDLKLESESVLILAQRFR